MSREILYLKFVLDKLACLESRCLFLGANIMIVNRVKCVLLTLHHIFVVYSSIEPQQNVLN